MAVERLQKVLAKGGISSRRAAEALIKAGRVRVNGRIITELGAKADLFNDKVEVDGKRVIAEDLVYVILHKPRGVVSTLSDPEGRPSVKELLAKIPGRAYPVGRLDFATSGALLVTNDGEFADGMLHPKKAVPKTYVLKVLGKMSEDDIERWRTGIRLEDGMTLPAIVNLLRYEGDKTWLELTIREGRNQQIRRMGEATRFPVGRLARTAFAGITTEGLRPGEFRHLSREELVELRKQYGVPKAIRTSTAEPEMGGRRGANPRSSTTQRGKPTVVDRSRGRAPRVGDEAEVVSEKPVRERHIKTSNRKAGQSSRRATHKGSSEPTREETQGPRYGGGSPGRRPYDVKKDWGGGAGRGASGPTDRANTGDRYSTPPGRGGRTRTTGTSGGIGAREDVADRVPSRRGPGPGRGRTGSGSRGGSRGGRKK